MFLLSAVFELTSVATLSFIFTAALMETHKKFDNLVSDFSFHQIVRFSPENLLSSLPLLVFYEHAAIK